MFNSCENFRAIIYKGESPSAVSASVFPVFMIALMNTARMGGIKTVLNRLKRNKFLKHKADREKKLFFFNKRFTQ